jgi:hypothetical protein
MVTRAEILNAFKPEDLTVLDDGSVKIRPTSANAHLIKSIMSSGMTNQRSIQSFTNQAPQFLASAGQEVK